MRKRNRTSTKSKILLILIILSFVSAEYKISKENEKLDNEMTSATAEQNASGVQYMWNGYVAEIETEQNVKAADHAINVFNYVHNNYMNRNSKAYLSIIPDKNYYLSQFSQKNRMEINNFASYFVEQTKSYLQYIDITSQLSLENYYYEDMHWKQETLLPVAEYYMKQMNVLDLYALDYKIGEGGFKENVLEQQENPKEYQDVYKYLSWKGMKKCSIKCLDDNKIISMYSVPTKDKKENSQSVKNGYDIYLSGAKSLITIKNPKAASDNRLVIFRDSFGSSIAPLFVPQYKEIVLIDIRYISASRLDDYVDFKNADFLFLYSMHILNNTVQFKK